MYLAKAKRVVKEILSETVDTRTARILEDEDLFATTAQVKCRACDREQLVRAFESRGLTVHPMASRTRIEISG